MDVLNTGGTVNAWTKLIKSSASSSVKADHIHLFSHLYQNAVGSLLETHKAG